jgi:hypothetical protein
MGILGENDDNSNAEFPSSHSSEVMDEVLKADVKPFPRIKRNHVILIMQQMLISSIILITLWKVRMK